MHNMRKTIAELHAMLKLHEKGIPKKAETPAVLAIREALLKSKANTCISGKMACKPFPHQLERAKDILGLIHTDVSLLKSKANTCISGKMACKPFPHQLERAKDILGLIHTDDTKETMGYYFYSLLENKIFVARNAEFFKNNLMVQEASESHGLLELSGSNGGLELIQEADTQPFKNTSEIHNKVDPQNDKVPICKSARMPQAPDRYGFYVDVEEYELGDLNEPPNYKATLLDLKFDKWLEAMNMEIQSIKDNQVWVLVDLLLNGRTVWNYGETLSPVTDIRAIRILLAIAAYYDYEIWQMDVKTAFLNGEAAYIFGIKILHDKCKRFIALSQSAYLEKILKRFWMENSKKGCTPMIEKPAYRKSQGAKTPSEIDKDDTKSQTGYVFVFNVEAMEWKSAKKSTTAMSSIEAEYIATAKGKIPLLAKFRDFLSVLVIHGSYKKRKERGDQGACKVFDFLLGNVIEVLGCLKVESESGCEMTITIRDDRYWHTMPGDYFFDVQPCKGFHTICLSGRDEMCIFGKAVDNDPDGVMSV
uniref:Reverse transcriptase Ty1/copia-type domain-containing protein n=1 Tax=Tanacetum cinerariifolium TaxID=118510 RepID=A0A6L2KF10_TANCI|nr:hypothetical protein [Tanacetum cinerariifolium]